MATSEPEQSSSTTITTPGEPTADMAATTATATATFRIPGTFAPEWLSDTCATACMLCEEKFTLIKRRHHCRSCGQIFCAQCCKTRAKLLYLNNEEARVCINCARLLDLMLPRASESNIHNRSISTQPNNDSLLISNNNSQTTIAAASQPSSSTSTDQIQGVLRSSGSGRKGSSRRSNNKLNRSQTDSNSSSSQQASNKHVTFSDGIRPGTDLSEASARSESDLPRLQSARGPSMSSSSSSSSRKLKISRNSNKSISSSRFSTLNFYDELGFLPPVARYHKKSLDQDKSETVNSLLGKVVVFQDIVDALSDDGSLTFTLLSALNLKVRIIHLKDRSSTLKSFIPTQDSPSIESSDGNTTRDPSKLNANDNDISKIECWCFVSEGLRRLGQKELLFVLAKEPGEKCIPRDVFHIYLMAHELALRGQSMHNLGSLVFETGLFQETNKLLAGVLLVEPKDIPYLDDVVSGPPNSFLICLLIQRSEIPWSKIFPMRLYYRFGHKYGIYPCIFINQRLRQPLYYEVGHSIISILGDFRNFLYSVTHIEGMRVYYDRKTRHVSVSFPRSSYRQVNRVLDKSSNEHVLAWSSSLVPYADGHLVAIQNDDGGYDSVEFIKETYNEMIDKNKEESNVVDGNSDINDKDIIVKVQKESELNKKDDSCSNKFDEIIECKDEVSQIQKLIGTSFVTFTGALKANQSGQTAKISFVEDGLLIQIQSCTMTALKNSIHYMDRFDIDCGVTKDALNSITVEWFDDEYLNSI